VKDLNELQAMNKDLLKHKVQLVQLQSTTEMKDRIDVLDLDMCCRDFKLAHVVDKHSVVSLLLNR
jgi:hypothetical protein